MKNIFLVKNEQGSALVICMLVLTLLTIMGVAATRTTNLEIQISGNDKWAKVAFYGADGGAQAMIRLLEQNIDDAGFVLDGSAQNTFTVGNMRGTVLNFYMNPTPTDICTNPIPTGSPSSILPSDNNRDVFMPVTAISNAGPRTNFRVGGPSAPRNGSNILMAAGYEADGFGMAGGGGQTRYNIGSQRADMSNSNAAIQVNWNHVY
ncbi:MAG: hypothetical protein GY729_10365 [Desulfobacteraceae bacterium]|nr:hypothetical protein [Desulfobacteraceae bacterium]